MKKNTKGDLLIAIVIMIAATVLAVLRFTGGQTVDGVLWSIIAVVMLLREIRRYIRKKVKQVC